MSPPFDVAQAGRWFAVDLNNRAWDLAEKPDRSAAETEQMIHAAHGSYWHWQQVGNAVNEQRALCLLACAYGSAGRADQALHYADLCAALSEKNGDAQSDFDRAATIACAARAHAADGNDEGARAGREAAFKAAEQLEEGERRVIETMCGPNVSSASP